MKKIFFSYKVYIFLLLIFLIIFIFSFNTSLRNQFFILSNGLINNYYSIKINNHLHSSSNLKAIETLEQQIKFTNFLTTDSKNSFLDNIYYNAEKIEKFLILDKDYIRFSEVVKKLIIKDPNIFNAIIWNAKIMSYNNSDSKKILQEFDKGINLSPSNPDGYRFVFDYLHKEKNLKVFEEYCFKYHNSFEASILSNENKSSFFQHHGTSFSNLILGIDINEKEEEFYSINSIKMNENYEYPFYLKETKKILNKISLIFNYYLGTKINLSGIELEDTYGNLFNLSLDEIYISSKNSFIYLNDNNLDLIVTSQNDQIINVNFNKDYENIAVIKLNLKFSKLNLTNKTSC